MTHVWPDKKKRKRRREKLVFDIIVSSKVDENLPEKAFLKTLAHLIIKQQMGERFLHLLIVVYFDPVRGKWH